MRACCFGVYLLVCLHALLYISWVARRVSDFLFLCWGVRTANKAVANAVFGVWEGGRCQEHRRRKGAKKEKVNSKEDCWILAFENPGVASDHPVTDDEKVGTLGYYFPTVEANQPKSGEQTQCTYIYIYIYILYIYIYCMLRVHLSFLRGV